MWHLTIGKLLFCMRLKASGSTKSPPSPAFRPTGCCIPFLPRAITYANCPNLLANSRDDLRQPAPRKTHSNSLRSRERMITREQIQELAQFEDEEGCALSFYFQPATPRNKAHKEEAILTKDLAREVLRQLEGKNKEKCESARADLDRIVHLSQDLCGNGARAKVIFACSAQGFWREYDLPAQLRGTQLLVNRHFHLKPLAHLLGAFPSLGVVLMDRQRARLFDLRLGELNEREGFFHLLPRRRGRSDGFGG